ncbi:hypothetical protein MK851_12480 [Tenacibaculum sp. 1B UA]|uniref:hypothetical protein n=1 Tax=Tenacibaculum sp. 1B UA TaxID=2922252 RepID=UPI002A249DE7|nr:hypothetical protein [Tenacibaculum sp. 1B UA]MDX8554434.1 hypothetical protein [Tenacibaculum sp. 1B UA]
MNIEINNLDYPPIPAERKGSYVFRISGVFCSKQNSQFKFPIHFNDSYKQLETQLGQPTGKSSDISNLWLNNDGSESFYSWHKVIDSPKGVQQYIEYNTNSKQVETVQTTIVENEILFILFDPLAKESINNFITSPERLATLGFVYWPIENQLFRASLQQKALAQKALNDVNTLVAFITQSFLNGYIYVAHFCTEQNFIKEYII